MRGAANDSTKTPPRPTITTGPNTGVVVAADDDLDTVGQHRGNQHAFDVRCRSGSVGSGNQFA